MADIKTDTKVLLFEDDPNDAELCIRALKAHHLANELVWVSDGAEGLDWIFGTGPYEGQPLCYGLG
jgi:two-component system response regulator